MMDDGKDDTEPVVPISEDESAHGTPARHGRTFGMRVRTVLALVALLLLGALALRAGVPSSPAAHALVHLASVENPLPTDVPTATTVPTPTTTATPTAVPSLAPTAAATPTVAVAFDCASVTLSSAGAPYYDAEACVRTEANVWLTLQVVACGDAPGDAENVRTGADGTYTARWTLRASCPAPFSVSITAVGSDPAGVAYSGSAVVAVS